MSEPDSFFGYIDDRQAWNRALEHGSDLSPRYISQSSFQINGGNEVAEGYPDFFRARNAEETRALVEYYDQAGTDIRLQWPYQVLLGSVCCRCVVETSF